MDTHIMVLQKNDIHSTLTTYVYCSLAMSWEAKRQGYFTYIDWPTALSVQSYEDPTRFADIANQFEWFFKQPQIENKPPKQESETWTWELGGWEKSGTGGLYAQSLSVIKEHYQKNLYFNDVTNKRGNLIVDKYGIDFSKTIGICWRGSDIYLESLNGNQGRQYTPIERYFPWIDKALEAIPDARIACTSEEIGILEPLFKRYPQAFLIEEFYQAPKGSQHNPERFSPISGYERGLQPALMVWFFSKCGWLIKNRASTSAVASWLSDGEIVNINHDERLGFPPHKDGVEYKGEFYL